MMTFPVGQRRPEEDLETVPDCSPVGWRAHSRAVTVPSQSNARAKLFSWLSTQSHCPRFRSDGTTSVAMPWSIGHLAPCLFSGPSREMPRIVQFALSTTPRSRAFSGGSGRADLAARPGVNYDDTRIAPIAIWALATTGHA